MTELPCPSCGSELAFLEQYNRFYCHRCQHYAPEGYGAKGARKCPTCGGVLSYVTQYDRFYCYRCNAYPPLEAEAARAEAPKATEAPPMLPPTPAAAPAAAVVAAAPVEPAPAAPSPSTPAEAAPARPAAVVPAETAALPGPAEAAPTVAAPTVALAAAKPEEAPKEERPPRPDVKPAVLRLRIFTMRKSELTDLCKAYELDASGTKDELQERLLSFLKRLEAEQEGEEATPEAKPEAWAPLIPAVEKEPERAPTKALETPAAVTVQEPVEVAPQPQPAVAATPLVVAEEPPAAVAAAPTAVPVVVTPEPVVTSSHVEHPCPTCGRELSFISQYGRWYCYSCQRYAPATKNACPTCGATMRFIDQYERWWCDSCRRYGPADLPKPRTAGAAVAAAPATQAVSTSADIARTAVAHRHGSPGSGIALLGFGIMLYVVYAALAILPEALNYTPPSLLTPADLALLNFLAFLLMAIGAVVGLASLRHRE